MPGQQRAALRAQLADVGHVQQHAQASRSRSFGDGAPLVAEDDARGEQGVDHLLVARLGEERGDRAGHFAADIRQHAQHRRRRAAHERRAGPARAPASSPCFRRYA